MTFYLLDNAQPNTQQWGYPRRGAQLSGTCIIHTAECAADTVGPDGSAENTAEFIRTRSDYGSYHTLVDSDSIIEMVPYEYEAWQDSETNPWAVGISAAVQADHWDAIPADRRDRIYRNMAAAAADFVTYMESKGITVPLRRITGAQARARVPGFCAHGDSGVSRHDPGTQFQWATFFAYTQQALGSAALATQGTTTPSKELFTVTQFDDLMKQASVTHQKLNGLTLARTYDQRANQRWHGQTHAKVNALAEVVQQLAAGQGVTLDMGAIEAASKAGAAEALEEVSGISAADLAAAIPAELAKQVADELGKRLNGGK